jgi:indole-3-glycerol phosphate synthase
VQASAAWTAPSGTLGLILAQARERVEALRASESALVRAASDAPSAPPFGSALRAPTVSVIAEIKRRSPSKGLINAGIRATEQAEAYERGGAKAISVLTEPAHFGGSNEDLIGVRRVVDIPLLKKDFHVDPLQLTEAKAIGASAALLIARALSPNVLRAMMDAAREIQLEVLVEVRDEDELQRALDCGATIIGINNRNLETLVIDPKTSERLLGLIPDNVIAIAESGVSTRADVERFARAGADAVLVGSSISAAVSPESAVADLASVPRVPRGN